MAVGLDSAKEETDAYEQPYLDRGIATLVFDGPGQGEGEYDFAIRGDYEVAVKAVVDHVMTRERSRHRAHRPVGRQPRRLLRAARRGVREAHQGLHRARRSLRLAGGTGTSLPELTREAFRVRSHCATQEEAKRRAANLSLKGVAQNITCPIFVMTGKLDRLIPWQHAERLSSEVKGPCTFLLIEDGNHVANNRAYRWRAQSADWLVEQTWRITTVIPDGSGHTAADQFNLPYIERAHRRTRLRTIELCDALRRYRPERRFTLGRAVHGSITNSHHGGVMPVAASRNFDSGLRRIADTIRYDKFGMRAGIAPPALAET